MLSSRCSSISSATYDVMECPGCKGLGRVWKCPDTRALSAKTSSRALEQITGGRNPVIRATFPKFGPPSRHFHPSPVTLFAFLSFRRSVSSNVGQVNNLTFPTYRPICSVLRANSQPQKMPRAVEDDVHTSFREFRSEGE